MRNKKNQILLTIQNITTKLRG